MRSLRMAGDEFYSVFYANEAGDPESNWSGNGYNRIEESAVLTLTPYVEKGEAVWPLSIRNSTPLESKSVTIQREP